MSASCSTGQSDRDFERSLLDAARLDSTPPNVQLAWADFAGAMNLAAASVETSSGLYRIENARTAAAPIGSSAAAPGVRAVVGKVVGWLLLGAIGGSALTAALLLERSGPSVAVQAQKWPALTTPLTAVARPIAVLEPTSAAPANAQQSGPATPELASMRSTPMRARRVERIPNAETFGSTEVPSASPALQPAAAVSSSALAAEVKRLDAARIACRAGAFDQALRLVESYHREFAHGVLGPDAEVVALEALVEKQERDEVARRAAAFLTKYPSDPHAAKVRRWSERVGAK